MKIWTSGEELLADDLNNAFLEKAYERTFGDGSDGDVVISSNTTLTRDMYYNNLTIDSGVILNTGGYRIFVYNTLTNNGTIANNGVDGNNGGQYGGGTGGIGGAGGTLASGTNGADGGQGGTTNYNGNAGTSVNPSLGVDGSRGGNNGNNSRDGGVKGIATSENLKFGIFPDIISSGTETSLFEGLLRTAYGESSGELLSPSAGSGSGAGSNDSGGGGAGGTGGIILIFARTIINNGTIEAKGGNGGGDRGIVYWGAGGGGGGAGGIIVLGYQSLSGSGTIDVSGGLGGIPNTGSTYPGQPGDNGLTGKIYKIKLI